MAKPTSPLGLVRPVTHRLGLIWGGTCGNLYDRAVHGYVRDFVKWFLEWGGRQHVWPNFNVADSAICVGVGLLVLLFLLEPKPKAGGGEARAASTGREKRL